MDSPIFNQTEEVSSEEFNAALRVLQNLSENEILVAELPEAQRIALLKAAGKLSRPDKFETIIRRKAIRKIQKQELKNFNKMARRSTGIRSARDCDVFIAPKQVQGLLESNVQNDTKTREYKTPHDCYVCRKKYTVVHPFYDSMCKECGDLNYLKRYQTADLTGQVALITGSRLKIGYQSSLMLLRAGATVIATTRFPIDSAIRFSKEPEFSEWGDRLQIYGLDLRHTPSVELFAAYIASQYDRLDILINNAAQTVRRPSGFYAHLMENERLDIRQLPNGASGLLANHSACLQKLDTFGSNTENLPIAWHGNAPGIGIRASAELSQIPYSFDKSLPTQEVFPQGKLDEDLQQVDLRETNSWRLRLGEIQAPEMLEVQLVNSVAPFVLINGLIGLMRKENTGKKHIVNVSAKEGKFHRFKKVDRHPHTNMAKAALNMMTHTSSLDFAKDGIFMNAVDTGWVTDEDPARLSKLKQELHDFQPPLDIVDGAARVCDPFFDGINRGKHWCGKFLKDYFPIDW